MKKIIQSILATVAVLSITASVHAQAVTGGPLLPGGKRVVAVNATNNQVYTSNATLTDFGLRYGGAIQLNLLGLGAGATNSTAVLIQNSVDGNIWQSALTLNLTGGGTAHNMCISNVAASAIRNWRVSTVTSSANGAGTNLNTEVWFSIP